ncbi:subtilisin-like protease SBT1.9 [Momordica charantia]|uniref:Subtilisin-like protease SBT1.9 n=1 Tax=Momordica charantia TaxID=3673 RepID=A0A6J1BPR9_MOMCH|nr:subtilisin-like protease SBT1.9 [Momordica charantia]
MAAVAQPHNCFYFWFLFIAIFWFLLPSASTETDNYIVHMDLAAMPKPFATHHTWYSATLSSVLDNPRLGMLPSKLIHTYNHAINGFSASITPSELKALQKSPGYVSSVPDSSLQVDTTHSSHFLGLSSDSGVLLSNYGSDVIIGFVDTGVWAESESFSDEGMPEIPSRWKGKCESGTHCNKKLIGARFFNRGLIAKFPNVTISMNYTNDTNGHGTHTAATAAGGYVKDASFFGYGRGTARGVAPRARVAIYKAIWEEGNYVSDVIAAIDQAILDSVDVLSLSLGLDGALLYEDPVAIATFAAVERGILVTTSAGNKGPQLGTVHNGAPWVLNVAAGTMDRDFGGTIRLGNGVSVLGSSLFPLNSGMATSKLPLVFMGGCYNLKKLKKVGHKIVVCEDKDEYNSYSLSLQVDNVETAKVGVGVFISNLSDWDNSVQTSFPSIFLSPSNGNIIKHYIRTSSNPKARVSFHKTIFGRKPAPSVARYSSRGPAESCPFVLKPDIMAPGDAILASWPLKVAATDVNSRPIYSKFNVLSGTSMSCPHAAGVAALLKAAHPRWSPAAIRSAMMTTADVVDNTQTPIKDLGEKNKLATPLAMGSGHVNPNKAVDPGLIYDMEIQDYVNVLCALNYNKNQIQTITRSASNNCKNPSLDLNYPSFIVIVNASDSNTEMEISREFKRTVTNVVEEATTYEAKLTPMNGNGVRVTVKPHKLEFKGKNHKLSFTVKVQLGHWIVQRDPNVVFCYLSWVEVGGGHVARSPIVVTDLNFMLRSHQKNNT